MKVVVSGAGRMGTYLASLLSKRGVDVILVDSDVRKLQVAAPRMDVATRVGCAQDWKLLSELAEWQPDLYLAMTDNDEANLVSCSIAKTLGYPRTVERPDGKILTVYYFNDHKDQERYIAATIWDPGIAQ